MKVDFEAYQTSMAAKKEALHPSGPPPPSASRPNADGSTDVIMYLQQKDEKDEMHLRVSKLNLVQSAMEELLNEVKVRDWEEADDVQVQEAMHRVMH
jgi:hypothetical protein